MLHIKSVEEGEVTFLFLVQVMFRRYVNVLQFSITDKARSTTLTKLFSALTSQQISSSARQE